MNRWANKVVLVTGGSSGLGLAIAQAFVRSGAKVAIAGRQQDKLDAALQTLQASSVSPAPQVLTIAADVTKQADVDSLVSKTIAHFGRLDAFICAAGRSTRGAAFSTTPEQFQELFDLNFLSAVRCSQAALPELQKQKGHLVFIGSLASKMASKHLGAYPASKFPLAAYAQQLRLELGETGMHVLLVCPGPIRRDDAAPRYADAASGLPAEANRPGGGVRIKGLDPHYLSQQIVRACEKRKLELILPMKARIVLLASAISSSLGDWLIRYFTRA